MIKHIAIALLVLLYACNTRNVDKEATQKMPGFRIATYQVAKGWGYSIFINNKEYIRQSYIPAVSGEQPFISEQQARTVAAFIVSRLKDHEGPSIRIADLVKLKVIPGPARQPGSPE